MKICTNCKKYPICEDIPKEECKNWIKQPYTVLVEVDGDIKKIERIN